MPPKKSKKDAKDSKPKKSTKKIVKTEESSEEVEEEVISEKSEEEDIESTEEINLDSDSELKECDIEKTIEEDNVYFNVDETTELPTDTEQVLITGTDRKTNPRLTRYEMVRILGERTKQLTMNAKPLVKNVQDISYDKIALEELKNNMIPFKIKRPLPNNKVELWDISELDKRHLESLLS